jgi:hypothetical protein
MPYFGAIIIRNPGPATKLEIMGVNGWPQEGFTTWDGAKAELDKALQPGDTGDVITLFEEAECDGAPQIELYDRDQALEEGVIEENEEESEEIHST